MSRLINVMLIERGKKIVLADGATAEVISNPRDGVWLCARYVDFPGKPSLVGTDEMIFAQDVVELLD
jgi:hypothetical protein